MLIKKINEVPAEPVEAEGVQDVHVRVLFGPKDWAPTFAMRLFELEQNGHTPFHQHPFEHQVMILQGELVMVTDDGDIPVTVGDVIMILPGERHQFKNVSDSLPAKFLCMVPVEYQK